MGVQVPPRTPSDRPLPRTNPVVSGRFPWQRAAPPGARRRCRTETVPRLFGLGEGAHAKSGGGGGAGSAAQSVHHRAAPRGAGWSSLPLLFCATNAVLQLGGLGCASRTREAPRPRTDDEHDQRVRCRGSKGGARMSPVWGAALQSAVAALLRAGRGSVLVAIPMAQSSPRLGSSPERVHRVPPARSRVAALGGITAPARKRGLTSDKVALPGRSARTGAPDSVRQRLTARV
jgi:hypothetical protein